MTYSHSVAPSYIPLTLDSGARRFDMATNDVTLAADYTITVTATAANGYA